MLVQCNVKSCSPTLCQTVCHCSLVSRLSRTNLISCTGEPGMETRLLSLLTEAYLLSRQMTADCTTTTTRRTNTAMAATPATDQADVHWVDTSCRQDVWNMKRKCLLLRPAVKLTRTDYTFTLISWMHGYCTCSNSINSSQIMQHYL